jgi:trichothecene 3-O-acetyltransferase-like protein
MTSQVEHLTLGPLDHLPPRHYTRFAIYLPLKPCTNYGTAFAELQRGLRKTFLQLPWRNGKVFWQSKKTPGWRPAQLEVQYTPITTDGPAPWQFKYNELASDVDIDELRETGFPTDTFTDQEVLWAPFAPDRRKGADVFIGQANLMPGACVLCAAISHSVADGMADVTIFKLWADHTRGDEGGGASDLVLPADSADRGALERLWNKERSGTLLEKMDKPAAWNIIGLEATGAAAGQKTGRRGALANRSARWRHWMKKEGGRVVLRLVIEVKGEAKAIDSLLAASTKEPELKSRMFYISPANFAALKRACCRRGPARVQQRRRVRTALAAADESPHCCRAGGN